MKQQPTSFFGALSKKTTQPPAENPSSAVSAAKVVERFNRLPQDTDAVILRCDEIVVKKQVRKSFDPIKLQELAHSINKQGLLQSIVIWVNDQEQLQLVAGERRLRAIRDILKKKEIRATICRTLKNAEDIAAAQLTENTEREPLTPMELAHEFDRQKKEFGYTNEQLSKRLGKTEATVSKHLWLLSAHSDVIKAIENDELPVTTFFNNRSLFEHGMPERADTVSANEDSRDKKGRGAAQEEKRGVHKEAMISIPESSARALIEVLQETARRLKMKPIEPIGDLSRKELKGLIAKHAVPISRKLRS